MPPNIYTVRLTSKREIALATVEFTFERPEAFSFEPGQHIEIIIANFATTDTLGNKRDFSLLNAPYENDLVVATRVRESAFKKALHSLVLGETVSVRGPLGSSFRLHVDTTRPAVFIAGGIGITPFISMLRYIFHGGYSYQIYLFYSNRRPEDTVYHEELSEYAAKHGQFKYFPTMTTMKQSTEKWEGEEGRISKEMIEKRVDSIETSVFYISGAPGMVTAMDQLLHDMGVSRDAVRTEEFDGY